MATARTYAGDGKHAEVDWGMMTNLDTNAEYISIIFIISIAINVISVVSAPGQLTASKVALLLRFPGRALMWVQWHCQRRGQRLVANNWVCHCQRHCQRLVAHG